MLTVASKKGRAGASNCENFGQHRLLGAGDAGCVQMHFMDSYCCTPGTASLQLLLSATSLQPCCASRAWCTAHAVQLSSDKDIKPKAA
jgi:hypothetical protein